MPTPEHILSLRLKLDHLDGVLAGLRTREAEALTLLEKTRSEAKLIQETRDNLEAQTYPINWIPNEILVQIFIVSVEVVGDVCDELMMSRGAGFYYPPIVLSHVCRKWRGIALSVSQLWSTILLSVRTRFTLLQTFVERSGNALLDVFASGAYAASEDEVCTLTSRWRSYSFTARNDRISSTALLLWRNSFPELITLRLAFLSTRDYQLLPRDKSDCFPKLNSLYLEDVILNCLPTDMFRNIRSLELTNPMPAVAARNHIYTLLDCLSSTLQLQELILANFVTVADTQVPARYHNNDESKRCIVELPYLREFIWGYPQVANFRHFISFLNMPSLQILDISLKTDDARRTGQLGSSSYPFLHLRSVEDLTIECDYKDALHGAFREIDYPSVKHLELRTGLGSKHRSLAPFSWSLYIRDPRLLHLTHLTLFRLQISQQSLIGSFRYMPSLSCLTLDMCEDAQEMVCFLTRQKCGCAVHAADAESSFEDSACWQLDTLVFRYCDELRIECLKVLVRVRDGAGDDDELAKPRETRRRVDEGKKRKIKPLGKRFQHLTISSSAPAQANAPVRLKSITLEGCQGIGEDDVLSLKDLGVSKVEWRA